MAVRSWEEKEGEGEYKNQISRQRHHWDKGGPHEGHGCQMLQSNNINSVLGSIQSSEDVGIVQYDHSMVSGGQISGVVAWRKSGIKKSDADVAVTEDGGDAFLRIACK